MSRPFGSKNYSPEFRAALAAIEKEPRHLFKATRREVQLIEVCTVIEHKCRGCLYQGPECEKFHNEHKGSPMAFIIYDTVPPIAERKVKEEE